VSNDFISRTARVPPRHYKRRYTISKHAIERFRERIDEEFRHRDDEDLSNVLDERVHHAETTYEVRDPRAPDEITTLRTVACRHATYYAVVRNSTVVTVLDEDMARNNFNGQWAPVMNAPFTVLRDLKLPPPALPTARSPAPPPALPAAPVAAPDPLEEAGVAYARARRQKHECTEAVSALRAELDRATEALRQAEEAVVETHQRLVDLAGGGEVP
jgi:hypothetical protein